MRIAVALSSTLFVLLAPAVAGAQSITTGAIKGVVVDRTTGEPLPGISVTVAGQTAITEADGSYSLTAIIPGTYDVVFELDQTRVVHSGVEVTVDNTVRLDQKIKIGEAIEVHGTPPPINLPSTAHEFHIGRPELEGVPHPGATFEAAVGGIGGSQNDGVGPAFSGSTSLENRYIVDGIDITGLTYGNVGTPVLNEFIQDLEVVTGGYNAEFGRATGGIVNIITRNGTDTFRGSIFGTFTPGFLTAKAHVAAVNASSIDVTAQKSYTANFGFEMGGPIVKGKAWWYLGVAPQLDRTNYDRVTKRQTDCRKLLSSGGLSNCDQMYADASPDIDPQTGFYITDDVDHETRTASSKSSSILAKVSGAPFDDHQVQLSLIANPSSSESPGLYGLPSSGHRSSGLTTDSAARWTAKFGGGRTEIEALVAWHRSTLDSGSIDPTLDAQPLQVLQDGDLGTWSALGGESAATTAGCKDGGGDDVYKQITNCPMTTRSYSIGGPGAMNHDVEDRREVRLSAIQRGKLLGSHEIKAGVDFENDTKEIARLYSGGALIQNDVNGGIVTVNRWAELAAPNDMDPRFDQTCTTDVMDGATGRPMSKSFRCAFLGGNVGDRGTQIGGQTINWAAYLRDSWQPVKNVTLNMGVRYEEQRLRYAQNLRGTMDPLTGQQFGDTALTLTGNFAPRVGVTWDPTNEGKAKLYAHWGRFFESVPMDINDRSFGGEVADQRIFAATSCGQGDPRIGGPDGNGCLGASGPIIERLTGSSGVLVAPGTQAEYIDEVLAGAEAAVLPDIVVGLTIQHRRMGRVIEDMSVDGANTYIIGNPGEFSLAEQQKLEAQIMATTDKAEQARLGRQLDMFKGIRVFDKPVRDYDAIELSVSRKFAPGLYMQGSYTYSRANGNYPGSISYDNGQIDPNISSQYDLIELLGNRRGALPQDRPHSIKLDGYYTYNLSSKQAITLGTRIRAISGIPENALAGHYLYGPDESFLLPRGQLGRTEWEHSVDIHLAYKRRLTKATGAELYVDVFNVYNNQGTFDVDNTYAPYYKLSAGGAGGEQQNANPVIGGTYDDLLWVKEIDQNGVESAKPIGRNPNFHNPTSRYAPLSAQIGFRVTF